MFVSVSKHPEASANAVQRAEMLTVTRMRPQARHPEVLEPLIRKSADSYEDKAPHVRHPRGCRHCFRISKVLTVTKMRRVECVLLATVTTFEAWSGVGASKVLTCS